MAQVVLKATFGEETHRVSLNAPLNFDAVRTAIAHFFPQLASLRISYKDEDGDCITVATDADINEAIRFFGKQPLKFTILADSKEPAKAVAPAPTTPVPAPAVASAPAPAPAAPTSAPVYHSILSAARAAALAPAVPAPPPVRLQARFVNDVSVPDGTVFAPAAPFRKTWRIRNAGESAWPTGCVLRFEAGDQMSGVPSVVPIVQAEQEIDLSVDFVCPSKEGKFVSYWRLCNMEGTVFGDRIWVEIRVEKPAPAPLAPAPAPTFSVAPAPVASAPIPIVVPFPILATPAPAVQPPLAPLPAPQVVQPSFAYQAALDQLKSMGFPDNERTRRVIVKNRGDVNRSSQDLIDLP